MPLKLSNNATSLLSASITNSQTTLSITSGDESDFPTLGADDWHPVTVFDGAGNLEIMRCTARSGITLTVQRAQEGTAGKAFSAGARVDIRFTAATVNALDAKVNGKVETSVAGGSDVTVTEDNALNVFHILTGDLTAAINYVLPTHVRAFVIDNQTTGAFAVTVKTAAGTGVSVPQGYHQVVMCDGTNIVPLGVPTSGTSVVAPESVLTNVVALLEQASSPDEEANIGKVFSKDVSGTTELFFLDSGGGETQLTKDGAINLAPTFASGTKLLFPQAAAPTGWTQDTDVNDKVLRVVSATGGGVTGGQWAITGLSNGAIGNTTLSAAQIPPALVYYRNGTLSTADNNNSFLMNDSRSASGTMNPTGGGGNSHTHAAPTISADGNWRPAYLNLIKCTKA